MKHAQDIIKALLRTEKSTLYEPDGKYLFLVHLKANKVQIRKAVEELYKVKVREVNTFISMGKLRRVRYQYGRAVDTKKALVELQKGQKIEAA